MCTKYLILSKISLLPNCNGPCSVSSCLSHHHFDQWFSTVFASGTSNKNILKIDTAKTKQCAKLLT